MGESRAHGSNGEHNGLTGVPAHPLAGEPARRVSVLTTFLRPDPQFLIVSGVVLLTLSVYTRDKATAAKQSTGMHLSIRCEKHAVLRKIQCR